jgi:hypothetical protein
MLLVPFGFKPTYLLSFGVNAFLQPVILSTVLLPPYYKVKPHMKLSLVTLLSMIILKLLDVSALLPRFLVTETSLQLVVESVSLLGTLMARRDGDYTTLKIEISLFLEMLFFMRIIFPIVSLLHLTPMLQIL